MKTGASEHISYPLKEKLIKRFSESNFYTPATLMLHTSGSTADGAFWTQPLNEAAWLSIGHDEFLQGLCVTKRLLSNIYKHGVHSVDFNNLKMIKKEKSGKK